MDFRRSGQVEALAGEAKVEAVAAEMANSIDQNPNCKRPTYPTKLLSFASRMLLG